MTKSEIKNRLINELTEKTELDFASNTYFVEILIVILKKWHIHDLLVLFNEEE